MKMNKQSQDISTKKEAMPSNKDHEESKLIDVDELEARVSFKSNPWKEKCKDVRCQIFGIMCLAASIVCSAILLILLRNGSTGKSLILEIQDC